uniref:Ig-like domain-containing protein n=1 Tax=Pygocentrus nattereri TaxID=42514 RepID=A0A3B4BQ51_PYGNA
MGVFSLKNSRGRCGQRNRWGFALVLHNIFSLVVPDGDISAQLGSSVVLPCELSTSLDIRRYEVRWHRPDKFENPVLLYRDLKVQENIGDPRYRGRASLIGELQKWNASLRLENLTVADRGEYVCYVKSYTWYEEASVFLSLPGKDMK